jgi:hypothetical protein
MIDRSITPIIAPTTIPIVTPILDAEVNGVEVELEAGLGLEIGLGLEVGLDLAAGLGFEVGLEVAAGLGLEVGLEVAKEEVAKKEAEVNVIGFEVEVEVEVAKEEVGAANEEDEES